MDQQPQQPPATPAAQAALAEPVQVLEDPPMLRVHKLKLMQLNNIGSILAQNTMASSIKEFTGDPWGYWGWIKEIKKNQRVLDLKVDDSVAISYQTSEGPPQII